MDDPKTEYTRKLEEWAADLDVVCNHILEVIKSMRALIDPLNREENG